MKDNWIKPFQDKLGDYELDLPQAAAKPGTRARVILPLLAGAAAAAALLLFFLPSPSSPDHSPSDGLRNSRLIAEVPARVTASVPGSPSSLQTVQRRLNTDTFAPEAVETDNTGQTAESAENAEEAPDPVMIPDSEPVKSSGEEAVVEIEWPEENEAPHRTGLSARMHFSPLAFQGIGNSVIGYFDESLSPMELEPTGISNDIYSSTPNTNTVYHPKSVNNYRNTEELESVSCDLPLKFGLSFRWQATGRFALESGLDYDFQRSRIQYRESLFPARAQELKMHFIGIPLKAIYSISQWERMNLYASAGAEAEFMVSGSILSKASGQVVAKESIDEHPMLFSATGAAGVEYSFNPTVGLYAEPGISWHMVQETGLPLYYKEHPLSFDLHVGLRFNL